MVSYTNIILSKGKKNMIMSMDAREALNKIQHIFFIKRLEKIGIEWYFINMIKYTYLSPKASLLMGKH